MPSKVKLFGRRRSSGNPLDIAPENPEPATSSFRVLERPDKPTHSYGAANGGPSKRVSGVRAFNSPLQQLRGKSADDLRLGPNRWVGDGNRLNPPSPLKRDRASAGTTNSGSSGYYESSTASARHSSSSTLPSSLDQEREPDEEGLFPRKTATTPMLQSIPADANEPLQPPPSFSTRAARALSFGQRFSRTSSFVKEPPPPPAAANYNDVPDSFEQSHGPEHHHQRDRSLTESSYASTAKPTMPSPSLALGSTDFDDDFGNMFAKMGQPGTSTQEQPLPSPSPMGGFHRTVSADDFALPAISDMQQESEPMFPPRSYSRQALTPSPTATRSRRDEAGSPYGWDERGSQDGMLYGSALSSPRLPDDGPTVPSHGNGIAPAFLGRSKAGYALVPERGASPGMERTSTDSYTSDNGNEKEQMIGKRQSQVDDGDRLVKRVELHDARGPPLSSSASNTSFRTVESSRLQPAQVQAIAGAARAGAISPGGSNDGDLFAGSSSSTPRAATRAVHGIQDESIQDFSPVGPPSRAVRPAAGHARTESGTPKRMTKAQFEMLQKHRDASPERSVEDAQPDDEDDDEDDAERLRQATRQRRKQEATMSVYRQQMKKVAGGGPADLPSAGRPHMDRSSSSAPAASMSALHLGGLSGPPPPDAIMGKDLSDEDEDVPLGVLQAHGFPGVGRPPTRMNENDAQRRISVAGTVAGGGAGQGNLPPFARRLPADPYFGASLVNPANRESLVFSSAQSMYGGAPAMPAQSPMGQPGGLVGVIAGEERARAARRGSPNPVTGSYNPMPLPSNMHPGMPRTMSMGSLMAPQMYSPSGMMAGMPPMPMMMPPQDQSQQQMQQFMQMQMQVMQNMLVMQQQHFGQSPQPQPQGTPDYLGVPQAGNRPMSMASQAPPYLGGPHQGRAMTMMNPPPQWDFNGNPQRPTSAMPGTFAPSVHGFNASGAYTPSIAPSERSNIGMPSRYRPVATNGDAPPPTSSRSQSMTSSMTLQALTNQQGPAPPRTPADGQPPPPPPPSANKPTIRVVDKPKGTPKVSARPVGAADEDEDVGWAEMAKRRTDKKFGWRRKEAKAPAAAEPALGDLYRNME